MAPNAIQPMGIEKLHREKGVKGIESFAGGINHHGKSLWVNLPGALPRENP
jgi:hypothetical protein